MSTSNQTSSPVLLTATTRWGGTLQQLGIHIREMTAPLIAIDGMKPCHPDADGLSDTSFCPIWVLGWQLNSFPINRMVADRHRLMMLFSVTPFSYPSCSLPLPCVLRPSCVLSPSPIPSACLTKIHHRAVFARDGLYKFHRVLG